MQNSTKKIFLLGNEKLFKNVCCCQLVWMKDFLCLLIKWVVKGFTLNKFNVRMSWKHERVLNYFLCILDVCWGYYQYLFKLRTEWIHHSCYGGSSEVCEKLGQRRIHNDENSVLDVVTSDPGCQLFSLHNQPQSGPSAEKLKNSSAVWGSCLEEFVFEQI